MNLIDYFYRNRRNGIPFTCSTRLSLTAPTEHPETTGTNTTSVTTALARCLPLPER